MNIIKEKFMATHFKKLICLVLLFVNTSWADILWEEAELLTWEEKRNELSVTKRERLDKNLVEAARDGEIFLVQELIEQGADVNCGDSYTILHYTRFTNEPRICKYTALMWAANNGDPKMIQFLIDEGALLNLPVVERIMFHYSLTAASFAQDNVFKMLINEGALIGIYSRDWGYSPSKPVNYEKYKRLTGLSEFKRQKI